MKRVGRTFLLPSLFLFYFYIGGQNPKGVSISAFQILFDFIYTINIMFLHRLKTEINVNKIREEKNWYIFTKIEKLKNVNLKKKKKKQRKYQIAQFGFFFKSYSVVSCINSSSPESKEATRSCISPDSSNPPNRSVSTTRSNTMTWQGI